MVSQERGRRSERDSSGAGGPRARGKLSLEELTRLVEDDQIDTVITAIPDMQGRLMGKRVTGHYFLEEIAREGAHACAYLLACDVEMDPQPGYRMTSWAAGYGDFRTVPDLQTLRIIPWLEKTALVICDTYTEHGEPQEESPRWVLKRQVERARALGFEPYMASELEFYLFAESYESARARHHHDLEPAAAFPQDYHVLQTTKDEWLIRQIRNGMDGAGVPVEFSKGEWSAGQHEINLRYADAPEMADRHVIYKNGVKEIAALNNVAVTFMAKWREDMAGSSFHLHSSLRGSAGEPVFWAEGRQPFNMSELFGWYVAGQVELARDFAYFFAPTINAYKRFQAGTFAPTAIAWGHDNRTCGFRLVGEGPTSLRIENRIPGGDANPYLAFAATIAAGLSGIERKLPLPEMFVGDAYIAPELPRIPGSLREAIDCLAASEVARAAFGETVVEHYLHSARLEQAAYDRAVTCWELDRYFERM